MNRPTRATPFRRTLLVMLAAFAAAAGTARAGGGPPPSITDFTKGMARAPGFITYYWDAQKGKIWLEVARWDEEFLHAHSLPAGVGSNDIGLDRGQWGEPRVVLFRRVGPKVFLVQPNYAFRASGAPEEAQAVRESFAESTLWGFTVAAEENGHALVDATDFFLSDVHGVAGRLADAKQGKYTPDASRSALYPPRTKNFPDNTEVEATLTFTGDPQGEHVRAVVPTPRSVTVREHHSFIRLPDAGYRPREFHPQCGYFWTSFRDYSAPLGAPLDKKLILRHRLRKKDPAAKLSEPVRPIVYYLDRGAPEPVRSALLDGARWWNAAFEAAGYKNAFRVELLPEGVDPMDTRYNVIEWVHRSTRGWSYGSTVHDPRTGEIIRGHVTLGSLRVRQDMIIAEGLLAPFGAGAAVSPAARDMALARLRQLSAHEVGHTLGLAHNFAASTRGDASVMDYPHPKVQITGKGEGEKLDLSGAYGVGVGAWDVVAIAYGYGDFPEGADEGEALARLRKDARDRGLVFVSDQDARPAGGAHPQAHLWDNGADAAAELIRILKVRDIALRRFGERNIPEGFPLALLEERLVPVYLLHRYQTEAAVKLLGGVSYTYADRGEADGPPKSVPGGAQRLALGALLRTIDPAALALPERVVALIPPRPQGYDRHRELFPRQTGLTFDPLSAAEAAADHTVGLILHPQRCARLVEQHARDAECPGLGAVIEALLETTWGAPGDDPYRAEVRRAVDNVVLYRLMALAASDDTAAQARALAHYHLKRLRDRVRPRAAAAADRADAAHCAYAVDSIELFLRDPQKLRLPRPLETPPGMPIGEGCSCAWHGR